MTDLLQTPFVKLYSQAIDNESSAHYSTQIVGNLVCRLCSTNVCNVYYPDISGMKWGLI